MRLEFSVFLPLLGVTFLLGSASGLRGRQTLRARRVVGDAFASDERPVCAYSPTGGFGGHVQVFVSADNTRYLEFDHDGVASQTEVKCKGPTPPDCTPEKGETWSLNTTQSCDFLASSCPCDRDASSLDFTYMQAMMEDVAPVCESWSVIHETEDGGPMRMLLVGLGGGALPAYILSTCPKGSARVESVEYDPRVVQAAEHFFGFQVAPGTNEVETDDGGRAVARRASTEEGRNVYDAVLVDCFGDGGQVPNSCKDKAFIGNVKEILKPNGKLIQQIWSPQYEKVIEDYRGAFGAENVQGKDIELGVNHLIIATKTESVGGLDSTATSTLLSTVENHYSTSIIS